MTLFPYHLRCGFDVTDFGDAVDVVEPIETVAGHAPQRSVPRDADADHVVAAAVVARVEAIITGERDLLAVGAFGNVNLMNDAQLREQLAAMPDSG